MDMAGMLCTPDGQLHICRLQDFEEQGSLRSLESVAAG